MNHLKRKLPNGTIVDRDWVVFSPSEGSVYCFFCKLYGTSLSQNEPFQTNGFKDWKNYNRAFSQHECSKQDLKNSLDYRTFATNDNTLDKHFENQAQLEMQYWRKVLQRVASVVKFMASRGLAFRGADQKFGSKYNGNYLGIIELLSEYDPFLSSHISNYGNKGKGKRLKDKNISE